MRGRIRQNLARIRTSFWLIPASMGAGALLLALVSIELDDRLTDRLLRADRWGYGGGVNGARAILQTVAGSMITLSGLVFSMTLVVLSMASSQFGPRLLPNFMRSTTIQIVLGAFLATFIFCLIVLSSVRDADENPFIPHLSVALGMLMAVASLAVLIHFTHHVSLSIQADEMVERVFEDLSAAINRLMPEQRDDASGYNQSTLPLPPHFSHDSRIVGSSQDGYLQFIDVDVLLEHAAKTGLVIRLDVRPGLYLVAGTPLGSVWPASLVDDSCSTKIQAAFTVGRQRTSSQDIESIVNQLVEIAARALSPGVNDPFTAIACIDRLASGFAHLSQRKFPPPQYTDDQGSLRIIAPRESFGSILDAAFSPLRQYARTLPQVTIRLLEAIEQIAVVVTRPDDLAELRKHAELITHGAQQAFTTRYDIQAAEARLRKIVQIAERSAADVRSFA